MSDEGLAWGTGNEPKPMSELTPKRLHEIRQDDARYISVTNLALDRRELLYEVDRLRAALTAKEQIINEQAQTIARLLNVHNEHVALLDAKERELQEARGLLMMTHANGECILYGDDGERQCNSCHIDFKRDEMNYIIEKITLRGWNTFSRVQELEAQLETARGARSTQLYKIKKIIIERLLLIPDTEARRTNNAAIHDVCEILDEFINSTLNPSKEKE